MFQFSNFVKSSNFYKSMALLSLSLMSASSHAQGVSFDAANVTITTIGVHGPTPYFRIQEPLAAQCAYLLIYIPSDKKSMYAQVLAAKLAGRKLSRVNYTLTNGPNSECHAVVVEME
ncbi:hypothetical protein O0880_04500 [Janthinobacterium sp. SUN118]|uniref:hypothetical protein n=1 Tax=Janthinobacterium sp. SUN118 TaxID=3004100 RepID=UPI0025AFA666|nr:hypothetical protein [Janthinobacterium sp. SUN118]MDN2708677.1 hypothetical protein [Janthinobacterium sp. SUN118]